MLLHGSQLGSTGFRRMSDRFFAASVVLLLLASGCQEDPRLHLSNPALPPGEAAARLLRLDRCDDLPASDVVLQQVIEAVNAERARHGLAPLAPESTLMQIADFYACRLAEGGFFAHIDPYDASTVDSRATSFGYAFLKIGENLAAGQRTAEQVVHDWLASPGHRANLLDPVYSEIGVAVKLGGSQGPYWVMEFGRPFTTSLSAADAAIESKPIASETAATSAPSSAPAIPIE